MKTHFEKADSVPPTYNYTKIKEAFRVNESKYGPWKRAVAGLLSVTILSTVLFTQTNAISVYVSALAEGGDPLSRIYSLLQDEISDPQSYEDYYQLASIAIGKGEYDTALGHLEQCMTLAADDAARADLCLKKASIHILRNDAESALSALSSVLEYDPSSTQALLLRAQVRLDREEYTGAAADLESYLKLAPDDTGTRSSLALIYERLERFEDAAACYDAMYALTPADDSARLNALRSLFLAGDYEKALNGFDTYLAEKRSATPTEAGETVPAKDELLATACFLKAACLMQLARYDEATAAYAEAITAGYDEALCLEQMVTCQYASEDYQGAIDNGEKLLLLESAPVAEDVLYQRMGVAAMSLEQYDKAIDYLTKSIERNPGLTGNHYYRGVSLLAQQQYQEAVEDFTLSIEEGFLTQYCYYNRGVCYVQLLDYESVLSDMEMTLTSGDEQSLKEAATDILWQLAQYYENQKAISPADIDAEGISE